MVVDGNGMLRPCIYQCGAQMSVIDCFTSSVYYHNNRPQYAETFKIDVSLLGDEIFSSHILFLLYHCSSSADKEKRSLFAFSVLMLGDHDRGVLIADSTSVLQCFEITGE